MRETKEQTFKKLGLKGMEPDAVQMQVKGRVTGMDSIGSKHTLETHFSVKLEDLPRDPEHPDPTPHKSDTAWSVGYRLGAAAFAAMRRQMPAMEDMHFSMVATFWEDTWHYSIFIQDVYDLEGERLRGRYIQNSSE